MKNGCELAQGVPPPTGGTALTPTTTTSQTSTTKAVPRTDREGFERLTERDPSTWTRAEIDRVKDSAFGLDYIDDPCLHEPDTWSPPCSPGVDLEDLVQNLEGATMVAHGRPEGDEVRKSGRGWKDQPKIRKPSEDFLRGFELTRRVQTKKWPSVNTPVEPILVPQLSEKER